MPWHPDATLAVVHGAVRWTYAELSAGVAARVAALRAQGLTAGQVVRVPVAPALDSLVMQHALARLGCGLLPVAERPGQDHEAALVDTIGAEWRWLPAGGTAGRLLALGTCGAGAAGRGVRPAVVVQTSGSTGPPKAAMLTPANVLASATRVNAALGLGVGDCWLCCLPRHHVGGLMIGYRTALAGAAVVLHDGFDAAAVIHDLHHHGVTHLSLVPPMLDRLLALNRAPPPALRVLLVGGQALDGTLARRAIAAGWPLHLTYGMTETASQVATSERLEAVPAPGVVGRPLPGIEVRCDGTPASPAPLQIRGPVVMAGYANPEAVPGLGLEDGWLVTSDLGYVADSGELAVIGRADELLVIGGEAVLPSRVEDRLRSAPGVATVAVVGLHDSAWGHRLVAAYTGRVAPAALEAWCRAHLPSRDRPREFRQVGRLPLLASGKLDRRCLAALFGESSDDDA